MKQTTNNNQKTMNNKEMRKQVKNEKKAEANDSIGESVPL